MTDPIADYLIRIKNAYLAKKQQVVAPASKLKLAIAQVLVREGFLQQVKSSNSDGKETLELELKYKGRKPAVEEIRQISKPGRRSYLKAAKNPTVLGGLGVAILSTAQGIMTDKEARKKKIGGEIICQVW